VLFRSESKILDEKRRIIVSKPAGYDTNNKRYAVLYLLDGDSHFHHTTGLVEFLSRNNVMPDTLVVAVTNTDRTRDMTPPIETKPANSPTAGGADNFIKFFQDELFPFIESHAGAAIINEC